MTELLTPDTFDFFAKYLLAGFVFIYIRSFFAPGQKPMLAEVFAEAIIWSLINQVVYGMISAYSSVDLLSKHLSLFLEVIVLPAVLGFLMGKLLFSRWFSSVCDKLSIPFVHPIQKAYFFAFTQPEVGYIIVTYNSGEQVYGYFGKKSLAASDQDGSDLYIEDIYVLAEDETWEPAVPPRSAWIRLSDVRSIEFIHSTNEERGI